MTRRPALPARISEGRIFTSVLALLTLVLPLAAGAEIHRWDFAIGEDQVRNGPEPDGSTGSPARGFAHFAYDTVDELLRYTISWEALSSDLTKLHLHGPAAPGENNPNHLFEIFNDTQDVIDAGLDPRSDSVTGQIFVDSSEDVCSEQAGSETVAATSLLPCLLEGMAYVNVHTQFFPMGEIRGNAVLGPPVIAWAFDQDEAQVRNAGTPDGSSDSPGSGRGSFRYEVASGTLFYTITWRDLLGDLTKLHIHGPADESASTPIHLFEVWNTVQEILDAGVDRRDDSHTSQIALDPLATECTSADGTQMMAAPGTLPCLLEGRGYVNVHTEVFPMGELRGNFERLPQLLLFRFPSQEGRVNPPTGSPASGENTLRYDLPNGFLHYRLEWEGLQADLTKLHIHGPATPDTNNPNHLFEIFNDTQEVLDAGLDPRRDAAEGTIALDPLATECTGDSGSTTVAASSTLPCLLEGSAYVNVHSEFFPMGEIRGNATPVPAPYRFSAPLSGSLVRNNPGSPDGSTESTGSGNWTLRYDPDSQTLSHEIRWQALEGELTKLHIHGPAGREASTPIHQFEFFNTVQEILDAGLDQTSDVFRGDLFVARSDDACQAVNGMPGVPSPGAVACLLEERAYLNVHSTIWPMGELRGNLVLQLPEPGTLSQLLAVLGALAGLRAVRAEGFKNLQSFLKRRTAATRAPRA